MKARDPGAALRAIDVGGLPPAASARLARRNH